MPRPASAIGQNAERCAQIRRTLDGLRKTLDEAKALIEAHLKKLGFEKPVVELVVSQTRGVQLVRGQHLVRPDGTVSLGTYGNVNVSGLTLSAAKSVIEAELSKQLQKPEVVVDVLAYNSKVYYIIFDQGGAGQRVTRLPITGNETVLDAIANINGLTQVSSKRIWIARPAPELGQMQILPVDWVGMSQHGHTNTNYQVMPGDRIYVTEGAGGLHLHVIYDAPLFLPERIEALLREYQCILEQAVLEEP
jgi:polysaccharide export outer membrane protein